MNYVVDESPSTPDSPSTHNIIGYICESNQCAGINCNATHYYYQDICDDKLIPLLIDEKIRYITPSGFQVYYSKQLNTMSRRAIEIKQNMDYDCQEPPRKRRKTTQNIYL